MTALDDIRRNAEFYASQVVASRKRLADALEKHRYERERLEARLAEDEAKARDFQLVVDAADAALVSNQEGERP